MPARSWRVSLLLQTMPFFPGTRNHLSLGSGKLEREKKNIDLHQTRSMVSNEQQRSFMGCRERNVRYLPTIENALCTRTAIKERFPLWKVEEERAEIPGCSKKSPWLMSRPGREDCRAPVSDVIKCVEGRT